MLTQYELNIGNGRYHNLTVAQKGPTRIVTRSWDGKSKAHYTLLFHQSHGITVHILQCGSIDRGEVTANGLPTSPTDNIYSLLSPRRL